MGEYERTRPVLTSGLPVVASSYPLPLTPKKPPAAFNPFLRNGCALLKEGVKSGGFSTPLTPAAFLYPFGVSGGSAMRVIRRRERN